MSQQSTYVAQVLSRRRPSSRFGSPFGVVYEWRALPCSSLPTVPGVASAVLASSPSKRCYFCFLVKIVVPISRIFSYVYIPITDISYLCHETRVVWYTWYRTGSYNSIEHLWLVRSPACPPCFCVMFFFTWFWCRAVWFHNRVQQ